MGVDNRSTVFDKSPLTLQFNDAYDLHSSQLPLYNVAACCVRACEAVLLMCGSIPLLAHLVTHQLSLLLFAPLVSLCSATGFQLDSDRVSKEGSQYK